VTSPSVARFDGEAGALNGAGGTFPAPLYQKWFTEYSNVTHVNVNYQAIGSGGGIRGIQDQTVDFGASDAPMTDAQLQAAKGGQIFDIPTTLGAIVPTYNVPETTAQLNFTADTLAGIYLGTISTWDDPSWVGDTPYWRTCISSPPRG
jgi:phosphate transport system substrate-binding protein